MLAACQCLTTSILGWILRRVQSISSPNMSSDSNTQALPLFELIAQSLLVQDIHQFTNRRTLPKLALPLGKVRQLISGRMHYYQLLSLSLYFLQSGRRSTMWIFQLKVKNVLCCSCIIQVSWGTTLETHPNITLAVWLPFQALVS